MAVDDIVGVRLRQPFGQDVEALAAIARARDHQLAVAGNTLLILDFRDKPRGIGLAWMDDDRKAESRWLDTVDLGKGPSFIGGDEDSVVVLHPHAVRRSRALHQAMDILGDRVMRQLRWHVLGAHSLPTLCPARTGILGEPDASR